MAGIKYLPAPVPANPDALPAYLEQELARLRDSLNQLTAALLAVDIQTAAPNNPQNGWIAYADGTTWNPGSGAGFYGYEAGAWVKL